MRRILFLTCLLLSSRWIFSQEIFRLQESKLIPNINSTGLSASPDGTFLAAGIGSSIQIFIREAQSYILGNTLSDFDESESAITEIGISNDGNLIAAATKEGRVHIFRRTAGSFKKIQSLAGNGFVTKYLSFSASGAYLAQSNSDNKCLVWKVTLTGITKVSTLNNAYKLCFSKKDENIAHCNGKIYKFSEGNFSQPKALMPTETSFSPDEFSF